MGVRAESHFWGSRTLVATATHHVVRVTVRMSVASIHRDIDITLPTASTLAEILPELIRMIDLPQVHRPWEAATVVGAPLDMHTPLHKLQLFDGSVITLHPQEPPTAPVVRDAAESLTAVAQNAGETRGLDVTAGTLGALGIAALATRFVPFPVALAVGVLALVVVAALARSQPLFGVVPLVAAVAAGAYVAGPRDTWASGTDIAIAVLCAVFVALAAVAVGAVMRLVGPAVFTAYCTIAALLTAGALGAWLPAEHAPAALIVLAGLLAVMATPGVASRAAGLQIPRIPTAGEEFAASDGYQLDVDQRSRNAVAIADAMSVAVAVCCAPALIFIGFTASGSTAWTVAFVLASAGAYGLHATRHHHPASRVAHSLTTLAALAALVTIVVRAADPHPALIVLTVILLIGLATAPLWNARLPQLEPTTVVWFERAEAAAIIAVIPLAVQLTGLFALIRGL